MRFPFRRKKPSCQNKGCISALKPPTCCYMINDNSNFDVRQCLNDELMHLPLLWGTTALPSGTARLRLLLHVVGGRKMRTEVQNHRVQLKAGSNRSTKDFCSLIDRSIKPIGICSVLGGLGIGAAGMIPASGYMVAIGVLLYLVDWFGDWWAKK